MIFQYQLILHNVVKQVNLRKGYRLILARVWKLVMDTVIFEYHEQLEDTYWWFKARRHIISSIIKAIKPSLTSTESILDIGCGTGATVQFLSEEYSCSGIDTSVEAITRAKKKYPDKQFINGFAPDDIIDLIPNINIFLLMDVLEHIKEDKNFLKSLINKANSGSYFIITVPALQSLWSHHDELSHHYRRYELNTFKDLWRDLPVSQELVSYMNTNLYPIVQMVRTLKTQFPSFFSKGKSDFFQLPGFLNEFLMKIFQSETKSLINKLEKSHSASMRKGVSLISVLKKN